ncbi:GPI-anchor transamidase-like isoform X1 [Apostichopus japonicus]|uniref:GPI-anchor transamidase-like isoform X1 n=1 Tax=Stichopus japonicus TaxID=307972 RepID=UPI003AB5B6CC
MAGKNEYSYPISKMAAPCAIWKRILSLIVIVVLISHLSLCSSHEETAETFFKRGHTNNWAVLVCTSRFWFNYRHVANVLSMYHSVKRLGIPDSQIILMLADDMACNPRNPRPASVFNNAYQHINVYGDDVEVDYRGYEVTVESFIRVLTGRLPPSTPRSKRLMTDDRSNVLVYMTGHGGDGFLKFQDSEEISSIELADAFGQMWQKRRYHEVLYIVDTCQAVSMFQQFYSPNILGVGSSQVGEDSLSHHVDSAIGVYIIDRYTYYALEFLEKITTTSQKTMDDFFKVCPYNQCHSHTGYRTDLFQRDISKVLVTDFFGSVRNVEVSTSRLPLSEVNHTRSKVETKVSGGTYYYVDQFPSKPAENSEDKKQRVQFSNQFIIANTILLAIAAVVLVSRR